MSLCKGVLLKQKRVHQSSEALEGEQNFSLEKSSPTHFVGEILVFLFNYFISISYYISVKVNNLV